MRFPRQWISVLLSIVLAGAALALQAQEQVNHAKGLNAEAYLSDTFDHVNLYNGNLTLAVPIGGTYELGGNLKYALTLVYNSTGWVYRTEEEVGTGNGEVHTWAEPDPRTNAGLGWTLSLGALYKENDGFRNTHHSHWLYVSPDGASHPLVKDADGRYYSKDGTFLRLNASTLTLEFPNGNMHTFDATTRQLKRMQDRFGNFLQVDFFADRWVLTDSTTATTGRTHTIYFANGVVDRVTLSTFSGDATWTFASSPVTLLRDIKDSWVASDGDVNVRWLNSVTLPANGGSYQFGYDTGDVTTRYHNPGVIRSATLPTGGHYQWNWTLYQRPIVPVEAVMPDPDYVRPYANTEGVASKTIHERPNTPAIGTVTYNGMVVNKEPTHADLRGYVQVNVTSPEGDVTQHFFNTSMDPFSEQPGQFYGLPFSSEDIHTMTNKGKKFYLSQKQFKANASGLVFERSVWLAYDTDGQYEIASPPVNPRVTGERIVYGDANYTETVNSNWNGLGKFRTVEKYGSVPKDDRVRRTFTDYSTAKPGVLQPWILNLYTEEQLTDDGPGVDPIAYTYFCFDPNGLMKRKRTLVHGPAPDSHDVLVAYEYDPKGNVISESYYGGDVSENAPLLDRASQCNAFNAIAESTLYHGYQHGVRAWSKYVLPVAEGGDYFTLNQTIEPKSGIAADNTDTSGVKTSYLYDALGRVTEITLHAHKADIGARTTLTYAPAGAAVGAHMTMTSVTRHGTTVVATHEQKGDAFGRTVNESEVMPDGTKSQRATQYTVSGWPRTVSEYGNTSKRTTYQNFDSFGRAASILAADGTETTVKYGGMTTVERKRQIGTQVDASGNVTPTGAVVLEKYDAHGRLISVREKSGPANAEVETTYEYDVRNNLSRVSIHHAGGGSDRRNVALAANGAQAFVSSLYDGSRFPASAMINGDRKGIGWGSGTGGWSDGTAQTWPDFVGIQFDGEKTIDEIGIYTLQDDTVNPIEPTETTTFTLNGIQDFDVGYYNAATNSYVYLTPVVNNNKVWRRFILPTPITTDKLSIVIRRSVKNYSRIVEVTAFEVPATGPNVSQVREFRYDKRGFLLSEVHPEITGEVTYKTDSLGRSVEQKQGNHRTTYAYDAAGRLTTVRGQDLTSPDPALRLLRDLKKFEYYKTKSPHGRFGKLQKSTRFNWIVNPYLRCYEDPATPGIDCPLFPGGILVSELYEYDDNGQLSAKTTRFPDNADSTSAAAYAFRQTFGYDKSHNLTSQTYPACQNATCVNSGAQVPRTVTYKYNQNRLEKVGVPGNEVAYGTVSYHDNRMIGSVVHANGVTDVYGKDPSSMARVASVAFTGTIAWNSGAYGYDGAGNVIKIGTDWYTYDPANRIKEGTAGMEGSVRRKQRYTHDPLGNLTQVATTRNTVPQTSTLDVQVDAATNRLTGSYYDNAGNFLGLSVGPIYQYDPLNMLLRTPGRTYLYNASDERVWMVDKMFDDTVKPPTSWPPIVETLTLRGIKNEVLREYTITQRGNNAEGDVAGNWQWMRDNIYRGTSLLAAELTGGGKTHYHLDHLGSTRVVTNQFGGKTEEYAYFPYGGDAQLTGFERLRFTGHERDYNRFPGHKLDYMHARFYGMDVGRFISVDPGRDFDPKQPQSWNRYSYVRGNPMNLTDPTGRWGDKPKQATTDGITALEAGKLDAKNAHDAPGSMMKLLFVTNPLAQYEHATMITIGCGFGFAGTNLFDQITLPMRPLGDMQQRLKSHVSVGEHDVVSPDSLMGELRPMSATLVNACALLLMHTAEPSIHWWQTHISPTLNNLQEMGGAMMQRIDAYNREGPGHSYGPMWQSTAPGVPSIPHPR